MCFLRLRSSFTPEPDLALLENGLRVVGFPRHVGQICLPTVCGLDVDQAGSHAVALFSKANVDIERCLQAVRHGADAHLLEKVISDVPVHDMLDAKLDFGVDLQRRIRSGTRIDLCERLGKFDGRTVDCAPVGGPGEYARKRLWHGQDMGLSPCDQFLHQGE